jgi:hypothetical protein
MNYTIDSNIEAIAKIGFSLISVGENASLHDYENINETLSIKEEQENSDDIGLYYDSVCAEFLEGAAEIIDELMEALNEAYHLMNTAALQKIEPAIYSLLFNGFGLLELMHNKFITAELEFHECLDFNYLDLTGEKFNLVAEYYNIPASYVKRFQEHKKLSLEAYEEAIQTVQHLGDFFKNNHLFFEMTKTGWALVSFCQTRLGRKISKFEIFDLTKDKTLFEKKVVTLRQFISDYCERRENFHRMLIHWRKCLNNENLKGIIQLPQSQDKKWFPGKAKHYLAKDLKDSWPQFREKISSLPQLKAT